MTAVAYSRTRLGLSAPVPAWILRSFILFLSIGLALWLQWLAGGSLSPLVGYTRYVGDFYLISCAGVELYFSVFAWRQFSREQPMWLAWGFMAAGSGARFSGTILAHWIAAEGRARDIGIMLAGPFALFLLALALAVVLNVYHGMGWRAPLKAVDGFAIFAIALFTARQVWEVIVIVGGRPRSPAAGVNWATDPLLCILLVEALLLWRRAAAMKGGYVASCWQAYSVAIAITALGNAGLWVTNWNYLPWPWSSITWFVWFPAAAAFAIGPACQFEAIRYLRKGRR